MAIIGAGVFGAWTAYHLQRAGQRVILLDAYGAASSRASSGGESRIIRMGYGSDEIYTRWSMRSLPQWQEVFRRTGQPLFHQTGVLWMAQDGNRYTSDTEKTLAKVGVRYEKLTRAELEKHYPGISFESVKWGLLEPESGALMARRAVQAVVAEIVRSGAEYFVARVQTPAASPGPRLASVKTDNGEAVSAGSFVFACGPWLGKVFPSILTNRIFPSRQEVYFFGVPPGDRRFVPPAMPIWINLADETYGFPDLDNRGIKIASDRHGPAFDPDTDERVVSPEGFAAMQKYVAKRLPALGLNPPVLETRVCQYENTSNGDFLIDRHPDFENVWLVGGGSGHGFKHGPALGEYVAGRVTQGGPVEPRFSLATKATMQKRAIF